MPLRLRRRLLEQASSSPLHNDVQIGRICSNLAQIIATTQFVDLGRMGSFPLVDLGITDPSATWCPFEVLGTWIKTSLLTPTPTPTLTPTPETIWRPLYFPLMVQGAP